LVRKQKNIALRYGPDVIAASALMANTTPFVASEMSGRDLVFLGSSLRQDGFAVRVQADGRHDGFILKRFDRDSVVKLKALERDARRMARAKECSYAEYYAAIWSLVLKVRSLVIEPMLERWNDLTRFTLVPMGTAFGLPYGVTQLIGDDTKHELSMSICPSARTMLLSSLSIRSGDSTRVAFIAGDAARGSARIPFVVQEVDAIGRIWNQQPVLFNRDAADNVRGDNYAREFRELQQPVGEATTGHSPARVLDGIKLGDIVHLSCHGSISSRDKPRAELLIDGVMEMSQLHKSGFRPGATVILSACSVGGIDSRYSSEILGFPTVVLGSGARNLIASIWPVPDSQETVDFMCAIHDGLLLGESPEEAFTNAIKHAIDNEVSPSVWAGYSIFGP
jgi:CHAT domain